MDEIGEEEEEEEKATMIEDRSYRCHGDNAWVYSGDVGKVLNEDADLVYTVLKCKNGWDSEGVIRKRWYYR